MLRLLPIAALSLGVSLSLSACGKSGGDAGGKPPPAPSTGAPVAFEVVKVTPGKEGALDLKGYNFSDKPIAGYGIVMRYFDAAGQVLKVNVGTPFEKDFDFWSMSGRTYTCKPKSWCSFEVDDLEIPDGATKATVLATTVRAIAPDGVNFEEKDLWHLPGGMNKWPEDKQ